MLQVGGGLDELLGNPQVYDHVLQLSSLSGLPLCHQPLFFFCPGEKDLLGLSSLSSAFQAAMLHISAGATWLDCHSAHVAQLHKVQFCWK